MAMGTMGLGYYMVVVGSYGGEVLYGGDGYYGVRVL